MPSSATRALSSNTFRSAYALFASSLRTNKFKRGFGTYSSTSLSLREQDDGAVQKRSVDKGIDYDLSSLKHEDLYELVQLLKAREQTPRLTFLLGGPGSGKGTLSELIVTRTGHKHVSVGSLLREAASGGTLEARAVSATISRGGIVTSEVATRLLLQHLYGNEDVIDWIVDGFPRTFANAVLTNTLGITPVAVIALELSDEAMFQRLRERRRRDDVDYIVRQRIVQFHSEWRSIKEFYRRRNLLVKIDADGSPEQVYQRYVDGVTSLQDSVPNMTRRSRKIFTSWSA